MDSNLITRTTELAMHITLAYINKGDTVIDATCGTGQDTAVLAGAVGAEGRVFAFDIQQEALDLTEERLRKEIGGNAGSVRLIRDSFASMGSYSADNSAAAVVFNLGYLPGGDHSITTTAETTLEGLEAALKIIRPGGIVTAVLYDGHEAGKKEKAMVLEWAGAVDAKKYHSAFVSLINQKGAPPEIVWITKKR